MSQQYPTGTPTAGLAATDPPLVGPFRLVRRLGQGGMGIVYLGIDSNWRTVAVKVVHSAIADQPQFRARFTREVHAARSVAGTYTARVAGADTQASPQWIATEYIPGPTLAEHIETHGAMPEEQVRLLGLGLAEAIEAIHAAGLIHRDLKPSNIILSADGPKVIDFGISHASDATSLTQTGAYLGSLPWMSPEQITSTDLTPASDAFSTGLLVAYAALGHHPHGDGRPEALAFRIVNQTPDLSGLSASLAPLVSRLLTTDPQARPTPAEVVTALTDDATKINDVTRIMTATWDATIVADPPQLPTPPDGTHTTAAPPTKRRRRDLLATIGTPTAVASPRSQPAGTDLGPTAPPTNTPFETPRTHRNGTFAKRALIISAIAITLVVCVSAGYAWAASRQTSPISAAAPAPSTTSTVPTTPAPGNAGIKPPEAPTPSTVTRTETQTATATATLQATPTDPKYLSSGYQCPQTPSTWSYDPTNQQLTLRTQIALRDLGYTLPANGVYDAATRDAVTRFQRNHGIVADGEAGSQTWDCIDAANAINQGTRNP